MDNTTMTMKERVKTSRWDLYRSEKNMSSTLLFSIISVWRSSGNSAFQSFLQQECFVSHGFRNRASGRLVPD